MRDASPPSPLLEVHVDPNPAGWEVTLRGELDFASAIELIASLESALAARPGGEVLVDLTGLEFIDVAGLRGLDEAAELTRRSGGRWLPSPAPRALARLLRLLERVES